MLFLWLEFFLLSLFISYIERKMLSRKLGFLSLNWCVCSDCAFGKSLKLLMNVGTI